MPDSVTAHTPGPWFAALDANRPSGYDPCEICCLPHANYDAVEVLAPARTSIDHDPHTCSYPEFSANARLIASAPELYEALKRLIDALEGQSRTPMQDIEIAICVGRAALIKAQGGTHAG